MKTAVQPAMNGPHAARRPAANRNPSPSRKPLVSRNLRVVNRKPLHLARVGRSTRNSAAHPARKTRP